MKDAPDGLSKRGAGTAPESDVIAVQVLTFMARDPEAVVRFLAASGLGQADLRHAASDPDFLVGVLDFVMSEEPLLLAFAADAGLAPETVARAHERLSRP